jgi:lipid A 3-O-deacylase
MRIGFRIAATLGALAFSLAAHAEPPQDPHGIFTFQVENDSVSTQQGTTDAYYTSGLRLGYTTGTEAVPGFLANFGHAVWGDGVQRISIDLSQSIFTPRNTQLSVPDPRDRPYAAWLRASGQLLTDKDNSRSIIGISLGVVGPSALGRQVQNGFHDLIGETENRGWGHQLKDEPAFQILLERTYRLPVARFSNLEVDALPALTVGLGNVRDYVQAGFALRLGQGLNSDFGAPRIRPGFSGGDAYTPTRPFAWYVFVGGDGQVVGRDIFLDGSTWRDNSPSVGKRVLVGEINAGAAIMLAGVRITYTQTWQTPEFNRQRSGLFNFGSLSASIRF